MVLLSTNRKANSVSLREAVLKGMPEDGGLYIPSELPTISLDRFKGIRSYSFQEIAFFAAQALLGDEIDPDILKSIVFDTLNFDLPLVKLDENLYILELFHGPTLSFKDFGARFMARMISYYIAQSEKNLYVLVATSGDTGSAVAQSFYRVPGIQVVLLYPSGKVSLIQEKQFSALNENITVLEIEGTFDDCQILVKQAFASSELNSKLNLTSANSINIARLIPQTFYYFYACAQFEGKNEIVISVPSGNFGNLTAGLMAKKMGCPVSHFTAAMNANDTFCRYLETGVFQPAPSKKTISNAMDVGNPSNAARIFYLYNQNLEALRKDLSGFSVSDDETREAIRDVFKTYGYLMDPHGAVGYLGLKRFFEKSPEKKCGIFLETAHPAKFSEMIEEIIGKPVPIPASLQESLKRKKQTVLFPNDFSQLKAFLLSKFFLNNL